MKPGQPSTSAAFRTLLARDVRLAWRGGRGVSVALGFYLVVVAVLPLGLGPDQNLLARIAPGILWIGLLLAALLSLDGLFERDAADGSLDLIQLGPLPLEFAVIAKTMAHWLTTALPLVLAAPVLALMLNMEVSAYGPLIVAMLAGTPAISALGTVGAALTLPVRRSGLLLALIMLPLFVPLLVFGVASAGPLTGGAGRGGALAFLTAISLAFTALSPFAAAAALRLQTR